MMIKIMILYLIVQLKDTLLKRLLKKIFSFFQLWHFECSKLQQLSRDKRY